MKAVKLLDLKIDIIVEEEEIQIEGNAIDSGDSEFDKEVCDKIHQDLDNGNVWAWAQVEVKATYKGLTASTYLGCCSYSNEDDFKSGGYFNDMCNEVLTDINTQLSDLVSGIVDTVKTILITGTYSTHNNGNVLYNVNIWGQTTETPKITLITFTQQAMTGYNELIDMARIRFCQYFNVDDFNITYIEHLIPLNTANQ